MAELLLELFSEEIPARMQMRAAVDLRRMLTEALGDELKATETKVLYGPRRIAIVLDGLPAAQADRREERRGPRADAPDKAIEGFLRGAGVTREQCEERETPKGTFLFAIIDQKGRPTAEVLAEVLPDVLGRFTWPKSMRWGDSDSRWVRPLHSIVALLDGDVVPFAFAGVTAGNETRGHRLHAPKVFKVKNAADYVEKLRAAKVVADPVERRSSIAAGAAALAEAEGLHLVPDAGLLDELAGLVEWPVVMAGGFDERFMDVPEEVLVTSMRSHQKYLALRKPDGALAPRFVVVANLEAEDGGRQIVAGNQRVLRARLSDAEFFWQTDREARLESRVEALDGIVFHARLGTLGDKVKRIERLAARLADHVPGADDEQAARAARLAKADLTTGMVGEFPELQGVMGRYYARHDKEADAVCEAIAQHYSPVGPSDDCPRDPVAVAVALADKIDTLVAFFGIGETPTGSRDPFALRRAALGVIRLVLENELRLPLNTAFIYAGEQLRGIQGWEAPDQALLDFFAERLRVYLREQGARHDLITAVFGARGIGQTHDDFTALVAKVAALAGFLDTQAGGDLLVAYRRAANIVRAERTSKTNAWQPESDEVAHDRFVDEREEAVFHSVRAVQGSGADPADADGFAAYLVDLARLRDPVDAFFEHVTVNDSDPAIRDNRLRLLEDMRRTMDQVADFSLIEG
ncbi:MAG: glycine--tRNA ligase subunit beta [Alphaproteobacteria bacterium]